MAYGKIKADAIIYDNSGSDVEKTIASLAADTEGTAIKSTGESGTAKFLRVDGDGTCSWQIPPDTTYSVGDGGLSQNNFTNADHTKLDGIAASANNYAISADLLDEDDMATNSDTKVPSQQSVKAYADTKAPLASPALTGTATAVNLTISGNLTVNGSTTTVNTATLDVEDKNIELGKVSSPSDTTADGGGITLKGASDKEIKWVNSTDNWTFNQDIEIATGSDSSLYITGGEGNNASLYLIADEGDDNGDYWSIYSAFSDNDLYFKSKTSGSYATKAKITEEGEVHDANGDLRAVPVNATTSGYTLVAADRGKCVTNTSGGVTIPYNVFAAGDLITIVNHSGSDITLTQGSNHTLYNSADGSTGNRTLAARGMATVWYQAQNLAYISGAGLS